MLKREGGLIIYLNVLLAQSKVYSRIEPINLSVYLPVLQGHP